MCRHKYLILLTSLMLIGLLGTASMSQEAGGTWTQKADMPTARYALGSAVVDGIIYVIGGAPVYDGITAVVEEYDPATDAWTTRADKPTATAGLCAAAVDGIIYAIGGWGTRLRSTVEAYDPVTDTWTTKASMPTGRAAPAIAVVDGIIYVIGGYDNPTSKRVFSAMEAYDPTTNTWTKKADMPTARYCAAACVLDGRIYVFGGNTTYGEAAGAVSTVEVYDPVTDTWTQASDMPGVRHHHTASVVDGKMYIFGGGVWLVQLLSPIVDVYDPATDTWTTAANLPTPRHDLTAAVVDGKIYAIGGRSGPAPTDTVLSKVYEFDPGLPLVISSVSPAGKVLETWGQMKKVQ